ncbi:MAG: hydroxyacylglutathione hydrolase [SAR324 cluster bacterium]|nr:hydroxyacylglutathione hydrolase [SAR324 cluster bacterium]
MKIIPIPCLSDNYSYLIICEKTGQAGVVDPAEFSPVWEKIHQQSIELVAILNTHHHWDHVSGNTKLIDKIPGLKVYGHHSDQGRIPGQNVFLDDGDIVTIGNLEGHITFNPGHTTGAVSYYFEDAAFTGDTMFAGGCGRLFEGTAGQMYRSLNEKIGAHPSATKIYFGHEYTESNLQFALSVEPGNQTLQEKMTQVQEIRSKGGYTTPSTLESEKQTNPFLRCDSTEIQELFKQRKPQKEVTPIAVLKEIRLMKDSF